MDAGGLDRVLGRYDIVTRSGVATRRIIVQDRRTHGSTASTIVEETRHEN
jgi:carbamoylphosphate synthase small subunit